MTLQEIKDTIEDFKEYSYYQESLNVGLNIEKTLKNNPNIEKSNPKEYQTLMNMVLTLYTLGIKFVSKDIFESLIKDHLVKIISITFQFKPEDSFIALIESKYSIYYEISRKNYIIEECLPLLKDCQDTLGNQYLKLSTDQPEEHPTIQNWLNYYDRKTKIGMKSNFERSKFLSNDPYVMNLSISDKNVLRNILYFYDYLHSDELDYLDEEEKLFLKELKEEENNQNSDDYYISENNTISEEPTPNTPDITEILEKIELKEDNISEVEPDKDESPKIISNPKAEEPTSKTIESNKVNHKKINHHTKDNSKILDLKNHKPDYKNQSLKINPKARKPIVLSMPKKILPNNLVNLRDLKK